MEFLLLPILIGGLGWLLGVIGFFTALNALGQVGHLRRLLAAQTAAMPRRAISVPRH